MKKIVYFYGGPGIGKSVIAAELFAIAKKEGCESELVREYIKDWIWEGRDIKPGDQIYIASKQSRKERICFGSVDLIISDSPMYLGMFYEEKHDETYKAVPHIVKKHEEIAKLHGYDFFHVLLKRTSKYNKNGRFQTEQEAKDIDEELKGMLSKNNIPFVEEVVDHDTARRIYYRYLDTH